MIWVISSLKIWYIIDILEYISSKLKVSTDLHSNLRRILGPYGSSYKFQDKIQVIRFHFGLFTTVKIDVAAIEYR